MWERLIPADPGLFFSKGDPHDPRLGEVVRRLESGEDPEKIEESMGDLPGDEDGGAGGSTGGDTLYDG